MVSFQLCGQDFHVNFQQGLPKGDLEVSTPEIASDGDGIYSNSLCRKITFDLFLSLDIPEEFRLENWPCLHDADRDAIQEMIETHHVIPIPAYDANSRVNHSSPIPSYSQRRSGHRSFLTEALGR